MIRFRKQLRVGSKKRPSLAPIRITNRNGRFNIEGMGAWHSYWSEPYHLLLTIPWPGFLALLGLSYVLANAVFALAYMVSGGIENARPGSFFDAFFFSVQTMASIGYGFMHPTTAFANLIVTIESLVGLLGLAMATGLGFARFSKPTARVLFSRVAVIMPFNGVPTLIFRTANKRRNQILEAQLQVSLLRDEITVEGEFMRRFYDLNLVRSRNPAFALTWSAMHPIDETSPLYEATIDSLIEEEATITVSLAGLDETVAQPIHARHIYTAQEILWNMRFVDVLKWTDDGQRYIDYNHFHDVMPR